MADHIVRLQLAGRQIILLGTAHISSDSVDEVKKLIEEEKPDHIGIEIDAARFRTIEEGSNWSNLNVSQVIKEGKGFLLLANMALSSFQKRMGEQTGIKPGQEMVTAVEQARANNIPFSLCDRDIQITLRRAWSKSKLFSKAKLMTTLISSVFETEKISEEDLAKLKESEEMSDMMGQLAKFLPEIKSVLIDERDVFLAEKIRACPGSKVLAVVGAGHVPGICRHLETFTEAQSIESINEIPAKKKGSGLVKWIFPALIVAVLGWGFYVKGPGGLLEMITSWAIITGCGAALGSIITLAHPLTILVALVTAPITTLHPLIGVGLFTGYVEAVFRKPRVVDFENLNTDLVSLKGFFRNRVTHILLVFFGSSLGASLGMIFGIPYITSLLGQG